jgi:hypothetical protein
MAASFTFQLPYPFNCTGNVAWNDDELLMNWKMTWREIIKIPFLHLPGETAENHKNRQS